MPVAATRDAIVANVADPTGSASPSAADAEVAVARLGAMSADLRGCAILDREGALLAASGDPETWAAAARELLGVADAAAGAAVSQAHIGTEEGEAFAVRHEGFAIVAASNRFALASLMFCDLRAILRDLVRLPAALAEAPAASVAGPARAEA